MIYSGAKHPPEISDTPNEFLVPRVCARARARTSADEKENIWTEPDKANDDPVEIFHLGMSLC